MRVLLIAGVGLILASCVTIPPVTLQHPETKQVIECEGATYAPWMFVVDSYAPSVVARQNQCVQDFQQQGYVRRSG